MTREQLWAEYHRVCMEAKANDRYDIVEPLAYAALQQDLRKLKTRVKV